MQPKDGGKVFTQQESTEMLQYIAMTMETGFERLGVDIVAIKKRWQQKKLEEKLQSIE